MNLVALNWNDLKNPFAGGAEVHLEEILRRLVRHGHQVTLLCSGWDGAQATETVEGVRIRRVGNRYNFNFLVPGALRQLLAEDRFDLLIEDINKIPFYTPLFCRIPTLVVIPHLFATTVFQEVNPILATYVYLAEVPFVSIYKGRLVNVISESTADELARRGIPRNDLSVVHCGIDRTVYFPVPDVAKHTDPTILYLGRIKKYKSIQHLIAAFATLLPRLPNARLEIVGDGDYLPALQEQVRKLGLEQRVAFPGFVPKDDKLNRLRRAHVAVLPSLKEGWGLTNIEANAVGTAVIAANTPGLRDSVRDGVSGLLYTYGDIHQLSNLLYELLTDKSRRQTLEQGGLKWASGFNWDTAADEINKLLPAVLERGT